MSGFRSRSFTCILYEEDPKQMEILDYIVSTYNFAFIRHDKDIYDKDVIDDDGTVHCKGDIKKPHYHVIITFENARSLNKIKDDLGVSHLETCNFFMYCRYLIHADDPKKYQYKKEEIETNILSRVYNCIGTEFRKEEEETRLLYNFIKSNNFISYRSLIDYALENNLLQELKKNVYFYKNLCDDFGSHANFNF